jgi:hypothetical protein
MFIVPLVDYCSEFWLYISTSYLQKTMSGKSGTILYDSSSQSPSTMAERKSGRWQGSYGKQTGPIDILNGWDQSNVQTLAGIIERQTHRITSVLLNQKEPVEILQVINLVAGLSRALRIVVTEREHMSSKIDSLTQQMGAIQQSLSAGQDHQRGQLTSDIKF